MNDTDNKPIGMATIDENGTISLTLRAEDDSGAHGNALLVYPKEHKDYEMVKQHVGQIDVGQQKLIGPFPGQ